MAGQGFDGGLRAVREIVQGPLMSAHLRPLILNRANRVLLPPPGTHQVLAGVRGLALSILQPPEELIKLVQPCYQLRDKIIANRVRRFGHRTASCTSWAMSRMSSRVLRHVRSWARRGM